MNPNPTTQTTPTIALDIPEDFSPNLPRWGEGCGGSVSGGKKGKLTLRLKEFLEPGEEPVSGEELVKRARKMNPAGFIQAMFLYENQHLIPKECRKSYLVFPGTILQSPVGYHYFVYLYWDIDAWYWNSPSLRQASFRSDDRVVCFLE